MELIYKDEVYKIAGCCMETYNTLRHGFLEAVYQEALEREFERLGVPYQREVPLTVMYKGVPLEKKYFADFVCYGKIIVECKAVSNLQPEHLSQVVNYLRATGYKVGILANFGNGEIMQWHRIVNPMLLKK